MNKLSLLILTITTAFLSQAVAQTGVNTSAPTATLEVKAKNATGSTTNVDGLLIPQVDRQRAQSMTAVPTSTLIYVNSIATGTLSGTTTNVNAVGYYYFDGSFWTKLNSSTNIYNADGTLSANRTVTQGANTLAFTGTAVNAFSVNGKTFSVDAANKNVGIGTSAPQSIVNFVADNRGGTAGNDFNFDGYGNSTYPALFFGSAGGTEAAPTSLTAGTLIGGIQFKPRLNSGWSYDNAVIKSTYQGDGNSNLTDMAFTTSGNTRLLIDPTGNIGMGTTTPQKSLHVNGSLQIVNELNLGGNANTAGFAGTTGQILTSNGPGVAPTWAPASAASSNIYNSNGTLSANRTVTQGANTLAFTGTAVNAFSVNGSNFSVDAANNRVGVGTSTPHAQLQLGNSVFNRKIVLFETANDDNQFYGFGVNSGILRYQVDIPNSDHVFYAGSGPNASTELMRIKGNGNVGVGTSSPGVKLDVAQAIGTSEATQLRILNTSPIAAGNTAYMGFNCYNGGGASWGIGSVQNSIAGGGADNNFNILYSNGGGYNRYLTLIPNGNVGVGTTAPQTTTHILNKGAGGPGVFTTNTANMALRLENAGNNQSVIQHFLTKDAGGNAKEAIIGINPTYGNGIFLLTRSGANDFIMDLVNGNFAMGALPDGTNKLIVGGSILASGTITPSDIRIKKDIVDNSYGLKEILNLRTINYRYKDEQLGKNKKLGFIAQEVKASMPELVSTANDEMKTLGVNYPEMTVVLTKAIQELQESIQELKGLSKKQQAEINGLKAQLRSKQTAISK